jgi:hypothetical protein
MYHSVTRDDPSGVKTEPVKADEPPASGPAIRDPDPIGEGRDGKKERVLHTRVPAVLERELKRFADNLRVPVSNLVRTILEDALSVADAATENVEERLRKAAQQLGKERERIKKRMEHDPLEGIMAFQQVTLALPTRCAKCEKELARGARANLGISEIPGGPRRFVCEGCLPEA